MWNILTFEGVAISLGIGWPNGTVSLMVKQTNIPKARETAILKCRIEFEQKFQVLKQIFVGSHIRDLATKSPYFIVH